MPSSDSEDFESADEGQGSHEKKERKKRNSSSNYSDNLESDQEFKTPKKTLDSIKPLKKDIKEDADGWDDFDIEDSEPLQEPKTVLKEATSIEPKGITSKEPTSVPKDEVKRAKDTGWDDFDDWEQDGFTSQSNNTQTKPLTQAQPQAKPRSQPQFQPQAQQPSIKELTDKMAAASTGGWGWGWSVDSLLSTATAGLNTATAGLSTITSQVSQGITTVLETGIGAPDPEELARKTQDLDTKPRTTLEESEGKPQGVDDEAKASGDAFPFGSLLSGVTKFVETTGTKVLAGGLDTLETIGKKTMEVLQDGDPGLAKKRAMFGLDPGDKPILSQVLREAKTKADEEDKVREEKREAKEVHYETLFDDFEGLVHLEALEMLSRQVSMRIEERLRAATPERKQDIKETMQQVAELCEMPEEDDDEDTPKDGDKAEGLHERLLSATQDLGLKLQFQPLVKQYTETLDWLSTDQTSEKVVYKRCVSALAQSTALAVQTYHKAGELLLTKSRRSTADEADALTQMTVVLTKHIGELATLFTEKLNSLPSENKEQINTYITNIFLEAGNSSSYIQNAFQLALPILQIGAV